MKKILIVVAALLATSMLFAQETQQVQEECEGCSIDQIPVAVRGASINTSDVDQFNLTNLAIVKQEGVGNYSKIKQSYLENDARVTQTGFKNHSDIDQYGAANFGSVIQMGTSNYAMQLVGSLPSHNLGAAHNKAYVDQNGIMNTSYQTQDGVWNMATVDQYGSENYAEQLQDSRYRFDGSIAYIEQDGGENASKQTQLGDDNDAYSYQLGNNNVAVSSQKTKMGGSAWNDSDIYQYGNDNTACVTQEAGHTSTGFFLWPTITSYSNLSMIVQNGTDNLANVNQFAMSGSNTSDINQQGHFNKACVTQTGNENVVIGN